MSQNQEKVQIRQVPYVEPETSFELTAIEFSTLQNFFNLFREPIKILDKLFSEGLESNVIKTKFIDQT